MKTCELPEATIDLILKLDRAGLSPLEIATELGMNYQQIVYILYNYDY